MSEPVEKTGIDYKSLNSNGVIDNVINTATTSSIATIISQNGFTFNSENIGLLLLLTSLGDIKNIIAEVIKFTKQYLFKHFSWIILNIPSLVIDNIIIKNIKKYIYKNESIPIIIPPIYTREINIDNDEIIVSLIYYIDHNPSIGKYSKKLTSTKYVGFSDIIRTFYYDNIILSNGVEIKLNKNIDYINNKYEKISIDKTIKNDDPPKRMIINNLYEFIFDDIEGDTEGEFQQWLINLRIISNTINEPIKSYMTKHFKDINLCTTEIYYENLLTNIYNEFNNLTEGISLTNKLYKLSYFMGVLIELNAILSPSDKWYYSECRRYMKFDSLNLNIKIGEKNLPKSSLVCDKFYNIKLGLLDPFNCPNIILSEFKKNKYEENSHDDGKTNIIFKTENSTLNIVEYSDNLLQEAFLFYKEQQSSEKIKIFNLSIVRDYKETKKENPEYETFQTNKKKMLDEISDSEDKDIKIEMMKQFKNPPSQFIIKHDKIVNIKSELVSEQSKPIDTLYLRKKDMFQLKSVLNNFSNCSEIYEELGIRKKLGLMFHGCPGTGKSTSIVTIASYLKKNIYYVNMNTIKTNNELQMIFDYVLKNSSKAGIIVIEEIEKQTNIVFKDHRAEDETMTDVLSKKEGKLNLSCLLNLLDGTLSRDETVYIMTTNHIDKLEPALFRSGRIDKIIEFKKCDKYQIELIYERIMKRKLDDYVLSRIPEDTYTPADIIFHLVSYIYNKDLDDKVIMEQFMQ
jgi:hypothetical protein